jgi:hypothetical protein
VEVVGAFLFRTKVKRRKVAGVGKLAPSSESPKSVRNSGGSGDGTGTKSVELLPVEVCRAPPQAVGTRTKERVNR